jgi:VIT1/CCC1 family predicted Fe2+/Mn2+ transporter
MAKADQIKEQIESWKEEMRSAYLYRIVAKHESKTLQTLFSELANEAEKQAKIWEVQIQKGGGKIPKFKPDFRTLTIGILIRFLGPKQIRTVLAAMKVRGMSVYLEEKPGHPMPRTIADVGRQHKALGSGNNLRAAVFGINDGLVSNASLIMGMAGAHANNKIIILAGIAGLLAGAFSMAAGEYVSVRSQREMFEYQIDLEKKELELYPKEETAELALIYHARGLPKEQADEVAATLMKDPINALDTLAREELGINPEGLVSPYGAAAFSFMSFMIGAAVPLIPFFFGDNLDILLISILATALSLFIVGALMSLFTGRSAWKSGLRMLIIGFAAGIITYFIGHLLGVQLG